VDGGSEIGHAAQVERLQHHDCTSRGGNVSSGHCFNPKGVGTKSEACHAADNVLRMVKKHINGQDVWRTHDQGPLCRLGYIAVSAKRGQLS